MLRFVPGAFALFIASAALAAPAPAPSAPEPKPAATTADFQRLIVGRWQEQLDDAEVKVVGMSTYAPDFTARFQGFASAQGMRLSLDIRTRWRIEGNVLVSEVTASNAPQLVPPGTIERDTILSLSAEKFVYRDSDGLVTTAIRLPEAAAPEPRSEAEDFAL